LNLTKSSYNQIYNNDIGINLWECFCDNLHPTKIRWNNISNNGIGINFDVWRNTNNIISDNIISKNNQGIMTSEIAGSDITLIGNKILNNTISDNTENGIYLNIVGSCFNRIEGNQIYSNGGNGIFGILCEPSLNYGGLLNRIEGNQIYSNGGNGILFISGLWTMIYGNNISLNNGSGIVIENSIYTSVEKNTLSNNNVGIYLYNNDVGFYLYSCLHNTIKKNNFFNNSKNAYFVFNQQFPCIPFALLVRLKLITTRNKWYGNFWDEPQIIPYTIKGSLGYWYYSTPEGFFSKEVKGDYIDWRPAQEPYDIPGMS
jgi:parallel beta-helix repeat protein